MMGAIKAIKTIYNGIEFRSRLEARWALFFDYCKIQYNYEIEGYTFNGINYLPDFYLSESQIWVEVKPNLDFLNDKNANEKILGFSKSMEKAVIVFVDIPSKAKYYLADKRNWQLSNGTTVNQFQSCDIFWVENSNDLYQPIIIDKSRIALEEFFLLASNYKFC